MVQDPFLSDIGIVTEIFAIWIALFGGFQERTIWFDPFFSVFDGNRYTADPEPMLTYAPEIFSE